ncbi:MAG: hypothetical protein IPN75_12710 [Dechloromonas sp.]|uniref:Uncharacterized protein n=1 Tax=Candidatus Dechloromonas phosphorivorans TaxID=2899244 RepID=A0A9D7LS28_9RHOO|nr:hypothetical protein [Candidatus Dechloromonas phosphorivorans]
MRSGLPAWDGLRFEFDDPRVPESIQQRVVAMAQPDWELCFADTKEGGEWWLFDDTGELIEAFWLEQ